MSKAKRNRAKRAQQPTSGTAKQGLPRYFDGIAEQDIDNTVEAWAMLNVYLQLTIELDDSYPVPDEVSAQDPITARKLAEGLAGLRPHAVLGLREDAAFFASRITNFEVAAKAILAEPRSWLRKSGYRPDLREFGSPAPASTCRSWCRTRTAAACSPCWTTTTSWPAPTTPTAWSVCPNTRNPSCRHCSPWTISGRATCGSTLRVSSTAPWLCTLSCLAIWLFFQPGAVKDPMKTLLALTQRGYDANNFATERRERAKAQNTGDDAGTT